MSYGNPSEATPNRSGSGIMFLVMLFVAGVFIMNLLRQQGNSPGGNLPNGSGQGEYAPVEYENEPSAENGTDSQGGIYGKGRGERPATHPDAGDWDMQDVQTSKHHAVEVDKNERSNRTTENGDWSMEQVPTKDKKSQHFNVSKKGSQKPKSKSTRNGDWELEEVDK